MTPEKIKIVNSKSCLPVLPTFYIGRGSPPKDFMIPTGLGNPQEICDEFPRGEAIKFFEQKCAAGELNQQLNSLYTEWEKLNFPAIQLACWCAPQACHASVIKKKLLEIAQTGLLPVVEKELRFKKIDSQFYTGVGSRRATPEVLATIEKISRRMTQLGYHLRSGAAEGCDLAFSTFQSPESEIYVADEWVKKQHKFPTILVPAIDGKDILEDEAAKIAASIHGNWAACSRFAKLLHRRNVFQVIGANLDAPSKLLICWTPCGAESAAECVFTPQLKTGGTATAIKIASKFNIPIINIKNEGWQDKIKKILEL